MQRFVYTPKVEVFIRCDGDGSNRIVDVTEDLIDGSVVRNVDQISTAQLTLQNKFGRYTGGAKGSGGPNAVRFRAMDRIIVRMARVGDPHLVFSGYLDETPYFQLYPGPVTLNASCTLKLLQNTYFDPGLPLMIQYFQQFGWIYDPASGMLSDSVGTSGPDQRFGYLDVAGGIGDVMTHVLHDIGNWPTEAIDIKDLPTGFLKTIGSAMQHSLDEVQKDDEAMIARLKNFLGTASSTGSGSGGTDPTGSINPQTGNISMEQTATLAMAAGFKGDNLILSVAVARAESTLKTNAMGYNNDGSYDCGLWQINTVHTPGGGGTGLPAPPGGVGTLNMPDDFNAVKASLPANVSTFMTNCQDPAFNAKQAFAISGLGTTWTPWATFNNGLHLPYMADAKTAVEKASAAGALAPTDPITGASTSDPVGTRNAPVDTTGAGAKIATSIVKVAISQIGTAESGGNNQGAAILKYQQTTGAIGQAWCGSFATWVYLQAGLDIRTSNLYSGGTASVQHIIDTARSKGWTVSTPRPGDLICWDGPGTEDHVAIVVGISGNNISYVGGNQGAGVVSQGSTTVGAIEDGNRTPVYIRTPGVGIAAADAATSGGTTDAGAASTQTDANTAALQAGWAILQTQSNDTVLSNILTGERAIANDISLLDWILNICASSGRSCMSKPNGEFFAFYPDYFNYFTDTPYFRVADIELVDLTVYENDKELTTHLFATGPIGLGGGHQGPITLQDRINSMVASVEGEAFSYFINVSEGDPLLARGPNDTFDPYAFLRRYGARPLSKDFPDVQHPVLLWLIAWREFTLQWAKRYTASCETTFLPELFPGTVVEIGGQGALTMFVQQVTHAFSREGGFRTTADLISPATSNTSRWEGLPISGEFQPSVYTTGTDFFDGIPNG